MKRVRYVVFLAALVVLIGLMPSISHASSAVTVTDQYLQDSDGWDYGVNFFINNNTEHYIYVTMSVDSSNNVVGAVPRGAIYMAPYEKHVSAGSFKCRVNKKAWSVSVRAHPELAR